MLSVSSLLRSIAIGLVALTFAAGPVSAENKVLKIGHIGVMSGPAASWGLINKYAALAGAELINEDGGFEIDGEKYRMWIRVEMQLPVRRVSAAKPPACKAFAA